MKLVSYVELLSMSKEKILETLAPIKVLEMRKQGELQVRQIESKIIESDAQVQGLTAIYPLDYPRPLDALDDRALLVRRRDQLSQILDQLFPTETSPK